MSTATRTAAKPTRNTLRDLRDRLSAAERAVDESQRLSVHPRASGSKGLTPSTRRDVQEVLQLMDSIEAKMQALRGVVEPQTRAFKTVTPKVVTARSRNLAPARDDVLATFENLLGRGELLESAQFQKRAGITRQALSKAIAARRMFYLEAGGVRAYPAFYLDASLERAQVEAVTKLLGDLSGGSKWLFFTTSKGSLAKLGSGRARTPLQALMDGDFDKVKQAAIGYAER